MKKRKAEITDFMITMIEEFLEHNKRAKAAAEDSTVSYDQYIEIVKETNSRARYITFTIAEQLNIKEKGEQ